MESQVLSSWQEICVSWFQPFPLSWLGFFMDPAYPGGSDGYPKPFWRYWSISAEFRASLLVWSLFTFEFNYLKSPLDFVSVSLPTECLGCSHTPKTERLSMLGSRFPTGLCMLTVLLTQSFTTFSVVSVHCFTSPLWWSEQFWRRYRCQCLLCGSYDSPWLDWFWISSFWKWIHGTKPFRGCCAIFSQKT